MSRRRFPRFHRAGARQRHSTVAPAALRARRADGPARPDRVRGKFRSTTASPSSCTEDRKAPLRSPCRCGTASARKPTSRLAGADSRTCSSIMMFSGSEHHRDGYFATFERVGATERERHDLVRPQHELLPGHCPASALDLALDGIGSHGPPARRDRPAQPTRSAAVVQNEKRQHENRPAGASGSAAGARVPAESSVSPHDQLGSMDDAESRLARRRAAMVRRVLRRGQRDDRAGLATSRRRSRGEDAGVLRRRCGQSCAAASGAVDRAAYGFHAQRADRRSAAAAPAARQWNVPGLAHADAPLLELAAFVLGGSVASPRLYRRLVHRERLVDEISVGLQRLRAGRPVRERAPIFTTASETGGKVETAIAEEWETVTSPKVRTRTSCCARRPCAWARARRQEENRRPRRQGGRAGRRRDLSRRPGRRIAVRRHGSVAHPPRAYGASRRRDAGSRGEHSCW